MTDDVKKRLNVVLVAGGKYHDIDFARLELLKLLAEDDRIRTRVLSDGRVDCPRVAPIFMETLGSQFLSHPPIEPYTVKVADHDHHLVEGVEPFETTDELYLMETHGELHVLLETEFEGKTPGFVEEDWDKTKVPVFYLHPVEKGEVLYLTLGHCRGHYDMYDLPEPMEYYPEVERCAWDLPVFYDLLRRGIDWAKELSLKN